MLNILFKKILLNIQLKYATIQRFGVSKIFLKEMDAFNNLINIINQQTDKK